MITVGKPTATMLGRVNEWIWLLAMAGAAVTM